MEDERIILSALWITLMLCYLLGDVMRIYAGDVTPGEIDGKPLTQIMLFGMATFTLIPILMVILSLILPYSVNRWGNIIVAIFLIIFNLVGLPYKSYFDNFLILVGLGFNGLTVLYAWNWVYT
ncbi:MAG: DUF6326 family protein [Candidatus Hodarchaeales archaeon]|jgi:hypothetical protein